MCSLQNDVTYLKPISNFPKKQANKNKLWFVWLHFPVKDPSIKKPFNRLASKIKSLASKRHNLSLKSISEQTLIISVA